jgi:ferredoxin
MAELGAFLDAQLAEILGATEAPNALAVMDDMLSVMSAHVTLHPSRHDFFVEGADTLLEAALRAGLAVNYGCSNGNCGLCKARVISGQVKKVRPHDYVLSEAEKTQGYTLLCSHAAVGDLVLEALETSSTGDIPQQQIVARIKAIEALWRRRPPAAPADAAQQPPALPRRPERDADRRRNLGAAAHRQLPLRRPQPAFPRRAEPEGRFRPHCVRRPDRRRSGHRLRSVGRLRAARRLAAADPVRRLGSRLRAGQGAHRARHVARRGGAAAPLLARGTPDGALPRQPLPFLGRRPRQFPLHGDGGRRRT